MNREAWLAKLADLMSPWYGELGQTIPKVRIAIGWPSAGRRSRTLGECWGSVASADGHCEIWIRPTLKTELEIGGVLSHELIHAAVGTEAKHGKQFKTVALGLGLEGKMRHALPGEALNDRIKAVLTKLGPIPHGTLTALAPPNKPQANRQLKVACLKCGYVCRTTRKWLEEVGAPLCPTCVNSKKNPLQMEEVE